MTAEAETVAARIAAASEVFPIVRTDDWDSTVYVTAEGASITAVVTDHKGHAKREYRAALQLVAETPPVR